MPNIAVDNLMSYYYDTIALYGEVEKHVKKSKADKESLEAFAAQAQKAQANYGVVFSGGGKMVVANLVEVGQPVCKDGGTECPVDQLDGFKIRSNAGASWVTRRIGPKPEGNLLVPIDRTPLLESAMAGSPDQARMEQYRLRSVQHPDPARPHRPDPEAADRGHQDGRLPPRHVLVVADGSIDSLAVALARGPPREREG